MVEFHESERDMDDLLSRVHFKTVRSEITGRFFSKEEAEQLKETINVHTITDPETRAMAARAWEPTGREKK